MRKIGILLFLASAQALGPRPIGAVSGAGADPFNFLFLDADARSAGMAGAYTALSTDANAVLYNPANLDKVERSQATFMHNEYFQGIRQEYGAFASRYGWGLNINTLSSGDVPRTTISNPTGAGLSPAGANDFALTAGYGFPLSYSWSAGAAFKFVNETLDGVSAQGYAADLGLRYEPYWLPGFALASTLQNIGPNTRFQQASEHLPLNLRGGLAYQHPVLGVPIALAADVSKERSENPVAAFGGEVLVAGVVPVRAGFTTRNEAGLGLAFGTGVRLKNLSIDYAFAPFGALGDSQRISLTWRWGEAKEKETPPPDPWDWMKPHKGILMIP